MNGSTSHAPTLGIGRLLTEGSRFIVPHHQRDYSWTEDEIEQLVTDIEEAQTAKQEEYFIGLMVFMPKDHGEYVILDGQQRLATILIILASIRSWLRARDYIRDAEQIQSSYIAVRELGRDDFEPRVVLNEINNPLFEDHVIRESPPSDVQGTLGQLKRYDSNRRLLEAVLFCRKKIEDAVSVEPNKEEAAERLFKLVKYIKDAVQIVRLTVPSEMNAYTVFETLNDRGLDLTVLDLIKNYLFGKAGSSQGLRDLQSRWSQMMGNLVNVRADDFLKAWWTSRFGRIQAAQLFPKFRKEVSNRKKVSKTMEDLLSTSEQYAALEMADDPLWAEISEKGRERIRALKLLGGRQVHPVLLSSLAKLQSRELDRLLHLLEVLIVRYQLIGGGRTGRLEIACAGLAQQIFTEKVRTATEAARELKDILPNDDEFRDSFKTKQETNNRKAYYILTRLEIQARQATMDVVPARELAPSGTLTVEHVLPKNPEAAWQKEIVADQNFLDDCLYRIGNMCLLTGINRDLGNKGFSEKKPIYQKSDLVLTKEMGNFPEWERENVEQRQSELAKRAVAYWRFN